MEYEQRLKLHSSDEWTEITKRRGLNDLYENKVTALIIDIELPQNVYGYLRYLELLNHICLIM